MKNISLIFLSIVLLSACFSENSQPVSVIPPSPTQRIVLTQEKMSQYNSPKNPKCEEKFNFDKPNTTVNYTDTSKGISFQVPYNEAWGNETYKLLPFETYLVDGIPETILEFGPIVGFEACSWVRGYRMYFKAANTADAVIKQVLKEGDLSYGPEKTTINGLTVVKFENFGLCSYPTMEVIGEKFNYRFIPTCGDSKEVEFAFIEAIIKTVKLL